MSRLRVLQVVDNLGMGGAETWLLALLHRWKDDPDAPQIEFLSTSGRSGFFDNEARALGAEIHYLRYNQTRLIPFAREFRQLLRDRAYAAVHDHQDFASGWHFRLASPALPPVLITHVHNPAYQVAQNYGHSLRRRLTGHLGKAMIARYATHVVGTSRQAVTEHGFDAPAFDHIPKLAIHCAFDPAPFALDQASARSDLRKEFGWPEEGVRVALFAGRIDGSPDPGHALNHKNSGLAVSIAIAACRLDPGLRVLFAGTSSPATAILEQRIAAAGLSDRIRLLGVRRDMARLMRGGDVLLFPSRSEGLGMVAVEAQAAGMPVLASTEVPRECVVVPDMVTFMDLSLGIDAWAQALVLHAAAPRYAGDANRLVAASGFSIENSAARLAALYGGQL